MSLESGTKLGPYEIQSQLGAGGMGEVYKAKDTRLDRTVAIKVLPSHLADNPDLKQRFEREARAVSSLNHPHICTLYDIGEQDGTDFLVMEYIEGESLADRLKKGALPLDQALQYAIEIADALDKAHRQGVVHRDLKPGNIMLTKSGAKLLDFGLAKLKAAEPGQGASVLSALPTEEKPLTEKGSILGTFQYMAPEQLEGKEADARTDIFAFGALLYEMVTGNRAFQGKSRASLIGAIMEHDPPPVSQLQSMSPPALDHVVRRCLGKDPDERWQTAHDVMAELKWIGEDGSKAVSVARRPSRSRLAWGIVAGLMVGAIVTGITVWNVTRPGPRLPVRFAVTLPASDQLDNAGIALSADGNDLIYIGIHDGVQQLYRRPMDQLDALPIRGTEGAEFPFFSPDGEWLGFFADGKLKKVSLAGGPPVTLCDAAYRHGASWGPDDTIAFASRGYSGLMQVRAAGGAPQPITTLDTDGGDLAHRWLDILPGGKAVLFTVWYGSLANARIAVQSLEMGERQILLDGTNPRYARTGHIVFARQDSLWAVPFDADRLEVTGSPTPLLEGIRVNMGGLALFALAGDGSLVYIPSEVYFGFTLVWVDRKGVVEPLGAPPRSYRTFRLSPDGERVAFSSVMEDVRDVWIYDIARGVSSRLTFGDGRNGGPLWSPDGERIFFASDRGGNYNMFSKAADGSDDAKPLTTEAYRVPTSVSSDGKTLVFRQQAEEGNWDIGTIRGDGKPNILLGTPFGEHNGMISPDDRWLAYSSNESGRYEVYVRPFPARGSRSQVSTEGGTEPMWSRDGRELFYRNGDKMMAVAVSTDPDFTPAKPILLFEKPFEMNQLHSNYDVAADGRFIMIRAGEQQAAKQLNVVLNWFEELKRLAPPN